jgi:hypothetical protein
LLPVIYAKILLRKLGLTTSLAVVTDSTLLKILTAAFVNSPVGLLLKGLGGKPLFRSPIRLRIFKTSC